MKSQRLSGPDLLKAAGIGLCRWAFGGRAGTHPLHA
jgi:hypothetical protein